MLLGEQYLFNVPPKPLPSSNNLLGVFACDVFGTTSKKIKEDFLSLNISFSFLVVPFHSVFGAIIYI
jgi:hypothetical protein